MGKVAAFGAVAVVAEISAVVQPGFAFRAAFVASIIVLVAVLAAAVFVPWRRLPGWTHPLVPVGFALWLGLLLGSRRLGGIGLAAAALVPLVWVAFYGREWEAVVVLFAVVGAIAVSSAVRRESAALVEQRVILWALVGVLFIGSTWSLRRQLLRIIDQRDEALRQAQLLAGASRKLNSILDPEAVVAIACDLAAEIAAEPGSARSASFLRVEGDVVRVIAQHGELETDVRQSSGAYGAWIPVAIEDELYGVLALTSRGEFFQEDLSRCAALGQLVELSLANALSHQRSDRAAATDALTGVANRRGLERLFAERRGRRKFRALAIDVDGLKAVNDSLGHAAGDELLVLVADTVAAVLRDGDVLARVGGDEFVALVFDAEESTVRAVADRMIASTNTARTATLAPKVSIGVASGGPDDDLASVLARADTALYQAKQQGGMRYVVGA